MSLSSLLLGSKATGRLKAIDTDLDALFGSQSQVDVKGPTDAARPGGPSTSKKKRKLATSSNQLPEKKVRVYPPTNLPPTSPDKPKGKPRKAKEKSYIEDINEAHGDNSDTHPDKHERKISRSNEANVESQPDSDATSSELVHESLRKDGSPRSKRPSAHKEKYTPTDETNEQRNARTIFIGNLSSDIAQKRPFQKQLQRHILSYIPNSKMESTRFRSIAFQNPTNKLPGDESNPATAKLNTRKHDRDRASSWRDSNTKDDSVKNDEKKFLTPSEKKKIAFINQEFHASADSVNAYMVFAHAPPVAARPANLPPLPPSLDPFEAARLAVLRCNGTMFMGRTIRVDIATKLPPSATATNTDRSGVISGDPKLTVFVGNLDFASKEEDLRSFFEGLVTTERGPPPVDLPNSDENHRLWVTRVRVVRDKDTQLGKGFAYVQFADRACVDEILALEEGKVKFAKRKLRVQRCKTLPGTSLEYKAAPSSKGPNSIATSAISQPITVPKGDPTLGTKLAHLSKEERKQAKSSDTDRLARRLAKKKARMALANKGVTIQSKERERVRKSTSAKKAQGPPRRENKGRVRSEKSIAKRNYKK
ncbi:hypothetical protein BJ138DRAFT_1141845 [Hygrophoropsis aurantiaca]|uniref:Uncharacterized protein n=1 Tax=Hygrophoropsis aurantiaca TaxID=72124 RepID=A0ACB8AQ56_9AGAM|nr:hypothetical protein BJ138DRAFT_1141845 [Hygrophoropsis aurantiaca]